MRRYWRILNRRVGYTVDRANRWPIFLPAFCTMKVLTSHAHIEYQRSTSFIIITYRFELHFHVLLPLQCSTCHLKRKPGTLTTNIQTHTYTHNGRRWWKHSWQESESSENVKENKKKKTQQHEKRPSISFTCALTRSKYCFVSFQNCSCIAHTGTKICLLPSKFSMNSYLTMILAFQPSVEKKFWLPLNFLPAEYPNHFLVTCLEIFFVFVTLNRWLCQK